MAKKKKTIAQTRQTADPIDDAYKKYSKKSKGKNSKHKSGGKGKVIAVVVCLILICAGILAAVSFSDRLGELFQLTGLQSLLPGSTIPKGVTVAGVDLGGMEKDQAILAVDEQVADRFTEETLTVTVRDRQFELLPSVSGAVLDTEAAVKAAFNYGTLSNPKQKVDILPYLQLDMEAITAEIAGFAKFFPTEGVQSGYEITKTDDGNETLTVTIGTDYYDFDETAFCTAILEALNDGIFTMEYPCQQLNITSIDLDAIYAQYCSDPVDAILDSETHEVTQSSAGYRFDLEAAREALSAAKPGDLLEFPFAHVEPEMTTDQLQSMLFRDELGSYTAYSSSSYNRDTNLRLACESINGIILYPGDSFSYNEALGERTPEKGYRPAASYMGNETVDSYGGGICQPSSSLYYACLIADLEIIQRSCHGFVSSYMPLGMDATVDWNGPDFQFRNDTAFPIRIDAYADGGTVTVTLIGTDTKDYYVEMDYEVLGISYPGVKEILVEPGSGYYDGEVKTTAYTGYTIQTYKLKYSKETDELISSEEEAYSYYYKRDKEVYKIKQEETTATTTAPSSDPTTDTTVEPTTEPSTPSAEPSTEPPIEPEVPTDPPAETTPQPPVEESDGNVKLPGEE